MQAIGYLLFVVCFCSQCFYENVATVSAITVELVALELQQSCKAEMPSRTSLVVVGAVGAVGVAVGVAVVVVVAVAHLKHSLSVVCYFLLLLWFCLVVCRVFVFYCFLLC